MSVPSGPILLATRSIGKLRELRPLFAEFGVDVIDLAEAAIPEDFAEGGLEAFDSFEENALAKARYFRGVSGLATVADDSGLEIAALGGRPGVHSKRWSGRSDLGGAALDAANNSTLLAALVNLESLPTGAGPGEPGCPSSLRRAIDRRARYVCVAAYLDATQEITRRGAVDGVLVEAARGEGGFGYDPFFHSIELGQTFGEASVEAKATVSHRARAFRALLRMITGQAGLHP